VKKIAGGISDKAKEDLPLKRSGPQPSGSGERVLSGVRGKVGFRPFPTGALSLVSKAIKGRLLLRRGNL